MKKWFKTEITTMDGDWRNPVGEALTERMSMDRDDIMKGEPGARERFNETLDRMTAGGMEDEMRKALEATADAAERRSRELHPERYGPSEKE